MAPLTVEQMLQLGYGCGLQTVGESYRNVMSHYDCFFLIEDFAAQRKAFDDSMKEKGFTEIDHDGEIPIHVIKDMTIIEAAKSLNLVLQDTLDEISDNSKEKSNGH